MPKFVVNLSLLILCLLTFTTLAVAAEKEKSIKKGLDSEHLQVIQNISQAVFAARRSQQINPDMKLLRDEIEKLRLAIQDFRNSSFDKPLPHARDKESDGSGQMSQKQDENAQAAVREQGKKAVQKVLERVRGQRKVAQTTVDSLSAKKIDWNTDKKILTKIQNLEDELELVLSQPVDGQEPSLKSLQERITGKPTALPNSIKDMTPTMSTRVRHLQKE